MLKRTKYKMTESTLQIGYAGQTGVGDGGGGDQGMETRVQLHRCKLLPTLTVLFGFEGG